MGFEIENLMQEQQSNSGKEDKRQSEAFVGWHVAKVFDPQEKGGKRYQELLVAKQVTGQEKDDLERLRVSDKLMDSVKGLESQNLLTFSAYRVNVSFTPEGAPEPIKFKFLQLARPIVKLSESREHQLTGRLVQDPSIHQFAEGRVANFDLAINRGEKDTIYHKINASEKYVDNVQGFKKGDLVTLSGIHTIKRSGEREFHVLQLSSEVKRYEQQQKRDQHKDQQPEAGERSSRDKGMNLS